MMDYRAANRLISAEVENLIEGERYTEALNELARLRKSIIGSLDLHSKARLLYHESKCLYELGHYGKALIKVKAALRLSRESDDHSSYADMKLVLGWVLVGLGRLWEAEEAFNESYVFYRRVNDYKSLLIPLSNLAQIHFIAGNPKRSCEVLTLSMAYAARCNSQKDIDIDKRNLARIFMHMGQLSNASSLLDSLGSEDSDKCGLAGVSLLRGMLEFYRFEFDAAEVRLSDAAEVFEELGTARDVAVCREYLGLVEHWRGNFSKARRYYRSILDSPEPTASAVAQTLRMLTDVYISEGKFSKALSTAKDAEAAILRINERRELGALWRAYGQIYTDKGDTEAAREFFSKSIDLLREIGARYELAMTYVACGESESYDTAERLSHLHTARMHFAEMDVARRVEQVDHAISRLRSASIPDIVNAGTSAESPTIIAVNPRMKKTIAYAEQIATSDLNILLTGETGTGKDLLARHIHEVSGRPGEFVVVNAAAVPNEMIESELFGYAEGAFTGARKQKPGRFELADNGTFYLNEIADASGEFQAKLLEVLESRQLWRLGETSIRRVNFRLIAACNRDLGVLMRENRFRRDLYHRLNEVMIDLPPLRERVDEIPALVRHFLSDSGTELTGCGEEAENMDRLGVILSVHDYPGNVRELKATVKQLAYSSEGDVSKMIALLLECSPLGEREMLSRLLDLTNWNRCQVAVILGVSEGTIRNRIDKHSLTRA